MNGIKLFRTGFSILDKYSIPATDWKSLLVTFSATESSSEPSFEAYKKFLVWDWKNGETPLILPLDNDNKPEFHYLQHFWCQYYPFLLSNSDGYRINEELVEAEFQPNINSQSIFLGGRNHWGHSFIDYYVRAKQSLYSNADSCARSALFLDKSSCPSSMSLCTKILT